ncbi:hypothetical protein BSKO_13247 [Bryopsis sp. KO-2023]|nr:hypothetical protein BSKO_13247 [Bryopsis sp. KO-2023]
MIMGYVCKYCQCKYGTVTPVPAKLTRHRNPQVGKAEEEDQTLKHAGRELTGPRPAPGSIANAVPTVSRCTARLFAGGRKSPVTVITAARENLPSLKCAAASAPTPSAPGIGTVFKHVGSVYSSQWFRVTSIKEYGFKLPLTYLETVGILHVLDL